MESGLLRVLKKSSQKSGDTGAERAVDDEQHAKVEVAAAAQPPPLPDETAETELPRASDPPLTPLVSIADPTSVLEVPPPRRSRVMLVAGIVAAVVLVADAGLVVVHHQMSKAATAATAATAAPAVPADPMPRYMVLPPQPPAPPAPTFAPEPVAARAEVVMADSPSQTHAHRHSRHHHSKR